MCTSVPLLARPHGRSSCCTLLGVGLFKAGLWLPTGEGVELLGLTPGEGPTHVAILPWTCLLGSPSLRGRLCEMGRATPLMWCYREGQRDDKHKAPGAKSKRREGWAPRAHLSGDTRACTATPPLRLPTNPGVRSLCLRGSLLTL